MIISKENLLVAIELLGHNEVKGIKNDIKEIHDDKMEILWDELVREGMVDKNEAEMWNFSPLGQMIVNLVTSPEIWFSIENSVKAQKRFFYIRNCYYLYVDECDHVMLLDFLPNLRLMIGAYAQMFEGLDDANVPQIHLIAEGNDNKFELFFDETNRAKRIVNGMINELTYTEETCTNELTQWLFRQLKEVNLNDEFYG